MFEIVEGTAAAAEVFVAVPVDVFEATVVADFADDVAVDVAFTADVLADADAAVDAVVVDGFVAGLSDADFTDETEELDAATDEEALDAVDEEPILL